jgi:hypothetical protein
MIGQKVVKTLTTAVVVAVATGISVVATAFGIFALLRSVWGEAAASVIVAVLFALLALAVAVLAAREAPAPVRQAQAVPEIPAMAERLLDLVRDKPLASAAVAAVAGFIAVRNPQILSALMKVFMDQADPKA